MATQRATARSAGRPNRRDRCAIPRACAPTSIEVDASVVGERLTFRWSYSRELHDDSGIRALADDVCTELRRAAADLDGAAPERSRFPAAGVAQRDLDTVFERLEPPIERGGRLT